MNKTCEQCGTEQTPKWYKSQAGSGFLCQKHYRKMSYELNKAGAERSTKFLRKPDDPQLRPLTYKGRECWQHTVRKKLLEDDVAALPFNPKTLTPKSFSFQLEKRTPEIDEFILRYEWLGKMPMMVSYVFTARLGELLAGVTVFSTPYADSQTMGIKGLELIISRGAVVSWAPKCLNSRLTMLAIKAVARASKYRYFQGYGDPEARELGTIYQACNFIYLGQTHGVGKKYLDPKHPEWGWFSQRRLGHAHFVKRLARLRGMRWDDGWSVGNTLLWEEMPAQIVTVIKEVLRNFLQHCEIKTVPAKHKYLQIMGSNRRETARLRREFTLLNHGLIKPYPKTR